jgi:hypothetical protein
MRSAETVLGIIRERGKRGLPLRDLYRQLYNPELYLRAYARLGFEHRVGHLWRPRMRAECLSSLIFRHLVHLSLANIFPGWPAP